MAAGGVRRRPDGSTTVFVGLGTPEVFFNAATMDCSAVEVPESAGARRLGAVLKIASSFIFVPSAHSAWASRRVDGKPGRRRIEGNGQPLGVVERDCGGGWRHRRSLGE